MLTIWTIALVMPAAGCTMLAKPAIPVTEPGWAREELRTRAFVWSCQPDDCTRTWKTSRGPLRLDTDAKTYGLHEIPGWNTQSTSARVAGGILEGLMRRQGVTTERVEIGHGVRTVTDSGETAWQMRCTVYWIDDQDEEYNKDETDHISRSVRRSEGAVCRVMDLADTTLVRWRFAAGIAPPKDSLAAVYDSVRAVNPTVVSASPPMSLERLQADGSVDARYVVDAERMRITWSPPRVIDRVHVKREAGSALATIHTVPRVILDTAPDATAEEMRVLRMLTALFSASFGGIGA